MVVRALAETFAHDAAQLARYTALYRMVAGDGGPKAKEWGSDLSPVAFFRMILACQTLGLDPEQSDVEILGGKPYVTLEGRLKLAHRNAGEFVGFAEDRLMSKEERQAYHVPEDACGWLTRVEKRGCKHTFLSHGIAGGNRERNPVARDFPVDMAQTRARQNALALAFPGNVGNGAGPTIDLRTVGGGGASEASSEAATGGNGGKNAAGGDATRAESSAAGGGGAPSKVIDATFQRTTPPADEAPWDRTLGGEREEPAESWGAGAGGAGTSSEPSTSPAGSPGGAGAGTPPGKNSGAPANEPPPEKINRAFVRKQLSLMAQRHGKLYDKVVAETTATDFADLDDPGLFTVYQAVKNRLAALAPTAR